MKAYARNNEHPALKLGGYTETNTQGGWLSGLIEGPRVCQEQSKRWDVYLEAVTNFAAESVASQIARDLKMLALQSSVLYTVSPVIGGFV